MAKLPNFANRSGVFLSKRRLLAPDLSVLADNTVMLQLVARVARGSPSGCGVKGHRSRQPQRVGRWLPSGFPSEKATRYRNAALRPPVYGEGQGGTMSGGLRHLVMLYLTTGKSEIRVV
jgi:hypothetical protein